MFIEDSYEFKPYGNVGFPTAVEKHHPPSVRIGGQLGSSFFSEQDTRLDLYPVIFSWHVLKCTLERRRVNFRTSKNPSLELLGSKRGPGFHGNRGFVMLFAPHEITHGVRLTVYLLYMIHAKYICYILLIICLYIQLYTYFIWPSYWGVN